MKTKKQGKKMKVGLINIESKVFNTAYMQISQYHKTRGDVVEWWSPLMHRSYHVVYCSSLFDFTDKVDVPDDAVCGGSGFNLDSRLSKAIESSELDYWIYPKCRTSYLWFSRGCIRKCPWCVVPEKEGGIRPVDLKNLNPRGEYITVCDNNFFANPIWQGAIRTLAALHQPVDLQGIDIRLLDKNKCHVLNKLKLHKQLKIAWDDPKVNMRPFLEKVLKYIPAWKLMCYVLIGFNSSEEEDYGRVQLLRDRKIDPFVMPYDRSDLYQRTFARWVNHKAIFKKVPWREYQNRVEKQEIDGTGWFK